MAYPRKKITMDDAIKIAKKNGYKIQGKAKQKLPSLMGPVYELFESRESMFRRIIKDLNFKVTKRGDFTSGNFSDSSQHRNFKMTVDIYPFVWKSNPSKGILQFESEIGCENRIAKRVEDDDLLDWVRTEMKKKTTEFDNACKFIESHEDQFRQWEEMQRQANIFYNKIQKNFVSELKANGDFQ